MRSTRAWLPLAFGAALAGCASPTPDFEPAPSPAPHVPASLSPLRVSSQSSDELAVSGDRLLVRSAFGVLSVLGIASDRESELAPFVSRALAVDDAHAYAAVETHASGAGALLAYDLADGTEHFIASTWERPIAVTRAGESVFWAERGANGAIRAAPADGGPATTLVADAAATALAVAAPWVFWADGDGYVGRVGVTGGALSPVAHAAASVTALAASTNRVYFADGSELVSSAFDGSDAVVIASGEQPIALALDGATLYFATREGSVERVDANDGSVKVVARGQHGLSALALDSSHVYFACIGSDSHDVAGAGVYAAPR